MRNMSNSPKSLFFAFLGIGMAILAVDFLFVYLPLSGWIIQSILVGVFLEYLKPKKTIIMVGIMEIFFITSYGGVSNNSGNFECDWNWIFPASYPWLLLWFDNNRIPPWLFNKLPSPQNQSIWKAEPKKDLFPMTLRSINRIFTWTPNQPKTTQNLWKQYLKGYKLSCSLLRLCFFFRFFLCVRDWLTDRH